MCAVYLSGISYFFQIMNESLKLISVKSTVEVTISTTSLQTFDYQIKNNFIHYLAYMTFSLHSQ